jgi:LysM repeat protein
MRVYFSIFIILGSITTTSLLSQITDSSASQKFRICLSDSNKIENDQSLRGFFLNLDSLKIENTLKVNIVHIGDSHIQGDYLSRTVRYRLQSEFGCGGRGFVFPYNLLNMYGPVDYKCSTNIIWESDRIFPREKKYPVGLVGYTLATNNRSMKTVIDLTGPATKSWGSLDNFTDYPSNDFDVVKLLYSNDSNDMPLIVGGVGLNGELLSTTKLPQYNEQEQMKYQYKQVRFEERFNKLLLCADTSRISTESVQLFGLVFENSKENGIVYHMAGVGACQLNNFLKSSYFVSQTVKIKPNLIIISLGANESVSPGFDSVEYVKKYMDLIATFKRQIPGVSILLTTPPDILYKGKLPISLYPVQNAIKRVADSTGSAVWNLHAVMGGERSNYIWYLAKYVGPDRIHFSPKGYDFQGLLLTDALLKSYQKYSKVKIDTEKLKSDLSIYQKNLNSAYDKVVFKNESLPQDTISTATTSPNNLLTNVEHSRNNAIGKNDLPKYRYHIVNKGDSVYSIARKYKLNYKDLLKINGLNESSLIHPGQKIRLR